jgi:hypothetical protein
MFTKAAFTKAESTKAESTKAGTDGVDSPSAAVLGGTVPGGTPSAAGRGTAPGRRLRRGIAASAVVAAVIAPVALAASPASAEVGNCSQGYVNGDKAWGTCTTGSGSWSLTVQCYDWGANTAYGNGPGSIYSTCPDFSHITSIKLQVVA